MSVKSLEVEVKLLAGLVKTANEKLDLLLAKPSAPRPPGGPLIVDGKLDWEQMKNIVPADFQKLGITNGFGVAFNNDFTWAKFNEVTGKDWTKLDAWGKPLTGQQFK